MALDKLRFHNILVRQMNAPPVAATELAQTVDEGIKASKRDLATKNELRAVVAEEVNRLLRWLLTAGITIGGAIIGLLIALIALIMERGA